MKKKSYIAFFLILVIMLISCKTKYYADRDFPYAVFVKNSLSGVINTTTKEIIIPRKFGWVDRHTTGNDFPPKLNEVFYVATEPMEGDTIFKGSYLYNINGKVLYNFEAMEGVKSFFYHNKQLYLITETFIGDVSEPLKYYKLLRILKTQTIKLLEASSIQRCGKNIISFNNYDNHQFGYFDLNTGKKLLLEPYSEQYDHGIYIQQKNEIWVNRYNTKARMPYPYYDTVIDSTLNTKPNPVKDAVLMPYQNYFFTETEKGIQITDFNGQTSPVIYPYITPVKNRITYTTIHPSLDIFLDKLFVFSNQKDEKIKGITDINGKIILPPEFNSITLQEIHYYTQPSDEFKIFIKNNKLENFFYYTIKDVDDKKEFALFNEEGTEIIKFKENKYSNCSPEFDLMEKNRLQIKFHCSDSLKIYDLTTKELIHVEAR